MIELKNLSIGYIGKKETTVVASDINATVPSGQLTCLLGPNGVGKSTLLRTLTAFQPKIEGDILIEGKSIDSYTEKQLARLIGVVLTERTNVQNMTVRELVALGRSPYTGFWGRLEAKDEEIVEQALVSTAITGFASRTLDTLSDGERQRAMIAKALAQQTPAILLDEPTAFLDYPSKVLTEPQHRQDHLSLHSRRRTCHAHSRQPVANGPQQHHHHRFSTLPCRHRPPFPLFRQRLHTLRPFYHESKSEEG